MCYVCILCGIMHFECKGYCFSLSCAQMENAQQVLQNKKWDDDVYLRIKIFSRKKQLWCLCAAKICSIFWMSWCVKWSDNVSGISLDTKTYQLDAFTKQRISFNIIMPVYCKRNKLFYSNGVLLKDVTVFDKWPITQNAAILWYYKTIFRFKLLLII